ncbi:MAG: triose-phosphate isomerase [Gemmatimonadota bacterium]|nr:triose-phosphate isomerase [Gemmatimonadota bacterium]
MRVPIVAGNWKMHMASAAAEQLARGIVDSLDGTLTVEVVVCPAFTVLDRVRNVLEDSPVRLGAQNLHWADEGAFTGEISAGMLLTCGCEFVILGHSERRTYFGETDTTVNQRLRAALGAGLKPIVCVGETIEERQSGATERVVERQVTAAFVDVPASDAAGCVVAYEPVWAIGTGLTASPLQAESVHTSIRRVLRGLYNGNVARAVRLQYGGSVNPENAADLLSRPDIDGGLIGGASLEPDAFATIVKAALQSEI